MCLSWPFISIAFVENKHVIYLHNNIKEPIIFNNHAGFTKLGIEPSSLCVFIIFPLNLAAHSELTGFSGRKYRSS